MTPPLTRAEIERLNVGPDPTVRCLASQLLALMEEREWRDISSAPRDYTWIMIAAFDEDDWPLCAVASRWKGFWQFWPLRRSPTHWMPLPPTTEKD